MAMQLVTITENDFSSGLDSSTAESNIKETFVQDCLNAIPDAGGALKTRTGYITYGGGIPIRVVSAETISTTKVRLTLDSSITVANLSRQPVIVYGTSTAIKDDSVWTYFPKATTDIPVVVPPYDTNPSQADVVLEQYKTGLSSKYALLGVSSTALGTPINGFLSIGTDSIQVDPVTLTVTTRIVNNTESSKYFFLYYIDPATTGETYKTEDFAGGSNVWSTVADALPNNNFLVRCYTDDGYMAFPDELKFDDTTSTITATFAADFDKAGHMVVVSGETSDFFDAIVMPSATTTINIQREIAGDVFFIECYKKNPLNNEYTLVCPDDIQFDTSQTYPLTVTFTNISDEAATVRIIWRKGEQAARSVITVEYPAPHGIAISTIDYKPQLVVYGPDHSIIYTDGSGERQGWSSFVDRYRTATEDRMICGLGWNSFQELNKGETLNGVSLPASTNKIYPSLRSRIVALGTVYTGPAISNGTPRTSANINTVDSTATGTLFATSITQSGMSITIATTLSSGTLTGSAADLGRYVTIKQAPVTDLLGDHEIKAISTTDDGFGVLTSIEFTIELEKGSIIDYTRFSGATIEWGIYTDELEVEQASMLIPGDKVILYGYETTYPNTYCLSAYTAGRKNYISLSNLTERRQLPNRMLVLGTRTTKLIPLRPEFDDVTLDENLWLVPGDMIQIDDIATEERIRVVTTHTDLALSTPPEVTVSGGMKTVEIHIDGGASFDTNVFKVGDLILLTNAGIFSGEYQIDEVLSDTEFCTLPKPTTAAAGTYLPSDTVLRGSLIEIAGEAIQVSDDAFNLSEIKVNRRWLPVDRSDVTGTYGTSVKQFSESSYTEQPFIRTVVARDSMFMTNGVDPVYKYDGRNYHLAGLPRVNPCVFVSKNTDASAKIPFPAYEAIPATNVTQTTPWLAFKARLGTAAGFKIGDYVQIKGQSNTGSSITNITRIEVNGTSVGTKEQVDLIEVDTALDGDSLVSNLQIAEITYRYYFKFLFIDRNNNVVQSATLGNQDVVVKLTESTRVQFRLVGLPMVNALDYSRIEIEVYRTRKNESAPFYRIRNVEVPYPILNYIDIYDSTDDALLTDLDYTTTALTSQELSTGLNFPPKARCITAASNRLLLGACTATPSFTLTITDGQTQDARTDLDYIGAKLTIVAPNQTYVFQYVNNFYSDYAPTDITHTNDIATVTCTDVTGMAAGDWIFLTRVAASTTNLKPRYAGWHKILEVDALNNEYTFAVNSAAITAVDTSAFDTGTPPTVTIDDAVDVMWVSGGIIPVPTPAGGYTDYFMDTVEGASTNPQIALIPIMGRAINTVMALESKDALWAEYGNDVSPAGTLIVKCLCGDFTVQYDKPNPALGAARIYINGTLMSGTSSGVTAPIATFRGSRIVKSYPNYAECFDNPDADNASTSDSIIDVNPADGETITAMVPMIGPSTTTSSQLQGTVIVFKEKSIYAVDVEKNSFEKLETNGVGAPYPNSVAQTSGGLAFASTSGVYKIDRSLRISKISGPADDIITASDRTDASRLQGHSFTTENQYKLSLSNGSVVVYNYEREAEGKPGAWAEYTNHPVAGGWANKGELEFFASTLGRIFVNRSSGTVKDYRDDSNTAINFDVKFRPTNFGDPAIRKQVRHVNIGFRNTDVESDNTAVSCAFDCRTSFTTLDSFTVETSADSSITQLRFGIPAGRLNYIQMRVQNSTIDEPIEITGLTYKVAGLKIPGTVEAAQTKRR